MSIFIDSRDKTRIEVLVNYQGKSLSESPAIIIAHPYGPLGGNMNNNVVFALQNYFLSLGYITVCLNFRGCGNSKGRTSWTGMPEREDYAAVMNFILDADHQDYKNLNFPKVNRLILCGYSFGAMIANSIECTRVPCSYLLVSICLGVTWALATVKSSFFKAHVLDRFKVLCVFGDRDQFTSASRYEKWCNPQDNISCIRMPGVDHFWFGFEDQLIKKVNDWVLEL